MKTKYLLLLLLSLSFAWQGCGGKGPTDEALQDSIAQMRNLPPENTQMPALPKEEIPEQNFDFGKFPNKWFALTKRGSEMVVEEPCDLDNRELRITNDNGHYQLFENMGDDGIDYTILHFEKLGKDKVSIRVRVPQTKKEQTFLCTMDEAKGTAVWKWKHEFGKKDTQELTFVDAEHVKNFKKIECR